MNADSRVNIEDRVERRPDRVFDKSRRIMRVYGWPDPQNRVKPSPAPAPAG